MEYRICSDCGARIDCGEVCSCHKGPEPITFLPLLGEIETGPTQYELYLRSKKKASYGVNISH